MYKIAICDDDNIFIQYMKQIIQSSSVKEQDIKFYEYYSGEELINCLEEGINFDLLILDMQLGKINGLKTAQKYREAYANTTLVFCSGVCLPSVKSFEVTPFRYLLKQYTNIHMQHEINTIIEEVKRKKQIPYIIGNYQYNMVKLKPEEILYISVSKHGSNIFVNPNYRKDEFGKSIPCKMKVEKLYDILKSNGFVYAHNSYIVNMDYLILKVKNEIKLTDGTVLTVARSKEKELRKAFAEYLSNKY